MNEGVPEKWCFPFSTDRGLVWRRLWGQRKGESGKHTGRVTEEGSPYPPQRPALACVLESCSPPPKPRGKQMGAPNDSEKGIQDVRPGAPPPRSTLGPGLGPGSSLRDPGLGRCVPFSPQSKWDGVGVGGALSSFPDSDTPSLGAACLQWMEWGAWTVEEGGRGGGIGKAEL